ncbi:MAG: division/cell wall cluster transcriptional repressor MraZ [Clostridiales bacterium]|jgi:MraZ protein|nr:division/cell wall cluster transcriptional repressor MraZ [Clostridiales bacterium]
MLLGEYNHSIDPKGRVIIPAKFREVLGDNFIITKGLDKCLFIYSLGEWGILHEKVKSLPITDVNARKFVRFFFGGAVDVQVDKQGRVFLPQNLRSYANIEKDIVTIGVSNRAEIWGKENWAGYFIDEVDGGLSAAMSNLGI